MGITYVGEEKIKLRPLDEFAVAIEEWDEKCKELQGRFPRSLRRTGAIKFKITFEVDGKPMVAHTSKLHQYGVVLKKTLIIDVETLNGEHGTLFFL